ncbi:MAG: ribonuclease HII [Candidatus Omnitrophica bacterium]|nr:ribonuclease HII [Candidatus Omnitrophota bacterium]
MFEYENELTQSGFSRIAGIDEAGRGPLAGPVVAAAVILPESPIQGINDSKKLTERQRESVFKDIMLTAAVGIGIVHHTIIDKINILEAAKHAMALAVNDLVIVPDYLLIDGKAMTLPISIPQLSLIGGDSLSTSIAAASIVAKVTRDRLMYIYDKHYPIYNFARHKGYPTKEHVLKLQEHGPSVIHRRTFRPVTDLVHVP